MIFNKRVGNPEQGQDIITAASLFSCRHWYVQVLVVVKGMVAISLIILLAINLLHLLITAVEVRHQTASFLVRREQQA